MKKSFFQRARAGFTLVEILVVIAILGILSGIVLGNLLSPTKKSRDARRKTDLNAIAQALEMYSNDHGGLYPLGGTAANLGLIMGCDAGGVSACVWGEVFGTPDVTYLLELPKSYNNYGDYFYASTDGSNYVLYAPLENGLDREAVKVDTAAGYYDVGGLEAKNECGGQVCNYAVHSTNTSPEEIKAL